MAPSSLLSVGVAALVVAGLLCVVAEAGRRRAAAARRHLMADLDPQPSQRQRATTPRGLAGLAKLGQLMAPGSMTRALERQVVLAGSPRGWSLDHYHGIRAGLVMAVGALGWWWLAASPGTGTLLRVLGLLSAAWLLPDVVIRRQAESRQLAIRNQLPDVLDQLTIAVEAGMAFEAAVALAASGGRGPLTRELSRCRQDLELGLPRRAALRGLAERTDVAELRRFVLTAGQAEDLGVPIARALRSQAAELRVARRQLAEERAQKLPVKLIFPLVVCVLPALFLLVITPAIVRLTSGELFGL
ncbi:MAG: type II secretion system F family protein [Acidimicrobiales bacterium]